MATKEKLIEKAQAALNSGNTEDAHKLIHKIKNYKNNPEALYILALCHAIKAEYSNAENLFFNAIKLTKPTAVLLGNLGLTQHHQQKIPEAIKSYKAAIKLNTNHYEALSNIAVCYDRMNENKNAIEHALKANALNPNNPEIINIIAKHKLYDGDLQGAIKLYGKSLSLQPQQPYIYVQLSNANFLTKEYDNAEKILKQATVKFPENLYILNSLGGFYATRNRHAEAIKIYETILSRDKDNTLSIAATARSLIALKKFDQARDILLNAHNKFNENSEISAELCNYLILIKDYESAYNLSKSFISRFNNTTDIPVNIAISHSTSCRHSQRLEEAKDTLSNIIERDDIPPETLETIHFSMGDILDDLKQYDNAFLNYKTANDFSPRPSDINYYESILNDLTETVDKEFLNTIGSSNNQSTLPVFILGMPRSGTSLVEQILSSHPDVYGAGELTDLWKIGNTISHAMNMLEYTRNFSRLSHSELKIYSETYIRKLTDLSDDQSRVTDKLPHNFMHIGLIECLMPKAKIIHCQRHPFDTCLSIYFRQFNDNNVYARKLEEIARFYIKYMELMKHWNENTSLSILTVNYEDMVLNQEAESRRMLKHIQLDWTETILNYFESNRIIMTPSYHQASKPIYSDSMYRWKKYTSHIDPLIKVLGDPEKYM